MGLDNSKPLSEEERKINLKPKREVKELTEDDYKLFYNFVSAQWVVDEKKYVKYMEKVYETYPKDEYTKSQIWEETEPVRDALLNSENLLYIRLQLLCLAKWYLYDRVYERKKFIGKAFVKKISQTDCKYKNITKFTTNGAKIFLKEYGYLN